MERSQGQGLSPPRETGIQGPEALPSTARPLLSALSRGLLLFPSQQLVVAHSFWVPKSSETDISLPQFRSPADCLIPVGAHRRHFCIWDEGVVGGHGHRQVGLLGGEDFPERPRIPGGASVRVAWDRNRYIGITKAEQQIVVI